LQSCGLWSVDSHGREASSHLERCAIEGDSPLWVSGLCRWRFYESGCLGVQPKAGGKPHPSLNTCRRPIAHKYREGKAQRTLKRELKELEIVNREAAKEQLSRHRFRHGWGGGGHTRGVHRASSCGYSHFICAAFWWCLPAPASPVEERGYRSLGFPEILSPPVSMGRAEARKRQARASRGWCGNLIHRIGHSMLWLVLWVGPPVPPLLASGAGMLALADPS